MEHIQNISNIIYSIKDNLTDGHFKTIMDNLDKLSKEVKTQNIDTVQENESLISIMDYV